MRRYKDYVNRRFCQSFHTYSELYRWSVDNIEDFWESLWDYFDAICSERFTAVCDDLNKFPGCQWFIGAKLNYAENMLRFCKQDGDAIIFRSEGGVRHAFARREI